MPLNLQNLRISYEDWKNVLKDTVGTEDRQTGTGYGVGAVFALGSNGSLDIGFKKTPQREKTGNITYRRNFQDGSLDIGFKKIPQREKTGYITYRQKFQDGGRAEEVKALVEGGHDVEFAMHIEPFIKNDYVAQYGSEIKEPMMDPEARPKDMFSTVNVRRGNRRGLAGMYSGDDTDVIEDAEKIIKEIKKQGLEKDEEYASFIRDHEKRKKQTPYERAEESFELDEGELRDKPKSFMPAKDASFVSLRQLDHVLGDDLTLDYTSKENPYLTKAENTALVFIHEARHKAVQKLNLRPTIDKALNHIPDVFGGPEELLMRFMDYKNSITPEQKENSKRWVLNFYESLNLAAKVSKVPHRWNGPFNNSTKSKLEFEKLNKLSDILNTKVKNDLEKLRGVPVYKDEDYPESLLDQIDRKGIFRTMFPRSHFEEALKRRR